MPQKPHAVRKKRARRIKKLVRWHEKRAEAEAGEIAAPAKAAKPKAAAKPKSAKK